MRFLEELETGKFGRGVLGSRDTGLVTGDNLFENPARYMCVYMYIYIYTHTHTHIYLSDFLRRYFGFITRVTKSVTICPPPFPPPPPNASEPGIGRKSLKISTF